MGLSHFVILSRYRPELKTLSRVSLQRCENQSMVNRTSPERLGSIRDQSGYFRSPEGTPGVGGEHDFFLSVTHSVIHLDCAGTTPDLPLTHRVALVLPGLCALQSPVWSRTHRELKPHRMEGGASTLVRCVFQKHFGSVRYLLDKLFSYFSLIFSISCNITL